MNHKNGATLRVNKWYSVFIGLCLGVYTIILLYWYNSKAATIWSGLILFLLLYVGVSISNILTRKKNDKGKIAFNKTTFATYVLVGIGYFIVQYF